jgi:hypothetical protein
LGNSRAIAFGDQPGGAVGTPEPFDIFEVADGAGPVCPLAHGARFHHFLITVKKSHP